MHVERKARFLIAAKLNDQRAATFTNATNKAFKVVPRSWKKTLTVDNGKEFQILKT
jgi:IS30 family transposase